MNARSEEELESAESTPAKSLLELAGMSMDPELGGEAEQVLKHLGEHDAAEFRFMQRELQQILLQSPAPGAAAEGGNNSADPEAPVAAEASATSLTHPFSAASTRGECCQQAILELQKRKCEWAGVLGTSWAFRHEGSLWFEAPRNPKDPNTMP